MAVSYTTMSGLSYAQQVSLFYNADIILAPHGSALVNMLFLLPHSSLVECFPPYFYEMWFGNIAMISRVQYFAVSSFVAKKDLREVWKKAEAAYQRGNFFRIRRLYADYLVNPPRFSVVSHLRDAIEYTRRWRFVFQVSDKWSPLFY